MTGVEIAVGYVFAWAVRKAKRVAGRADEEVDRALDAGMDQLHDLVGRKLGDDPALTRATAEAEAGEHELSERTKRRLTDSLEDAVERDAGFAEELNELVKQLQTVSGAVGSADSGGTLSGSSFTGPTAVQMGNHNHQENRFGV